MRCFGRLLTHAGGWFLDVLIAYLVRVIARSFIALRSREWATCRAAVISSGCPDVFGCEAVEVKYAYSVNGHRYAGVDTKPFLSKQIAKINAEEFSPGKEITVRYKPDDPSVSVFRYS